MVVARAANSHHSPAVKDLLSSSSRVMSQRLSEQLPSLSFRERFGMPTPTPSQASSGPLRVTVRVGPTPVAPPRRFSTKYTRSFTDDLSVAASRESHGAGRRVRFELPPTPSPLFACGTVALSSSTGGSGGNAKQQQPPPPLQVAGVDSWLRSRLNTASSTQNNTYASTTLPHSTPRLTTTTTKTTTTTTTSKAAATAASRVHDTGRYRKGTLPSSSSNAPTEAVQAGMSGTLTPGAAAILKAARDGDEKGLLQILQNEDRTGRVVVDVNTADGSGMTAVGIVAALGNMPMLQALLAAPGCDVNHRDNDGNTALHFAAEAGNADVVNYILTHCSEVDVDARNEAGITPLMKAALQGRNRCAKLLIIGGASPTLKGGGKGMRPHEWARHCGRFVCSEMIVKMSRHRYTGDRRVSDGRWGSEPDLLLPDTSQQNTAAGTHSRAHKRLANKLKFALWTRAAPKHHNPSTDVVAHLTTAVALCASTPLLSSNNVFASKGSPGIRCMVRPLVVPRLLVTPVTACDLTAEATTPSTSGAAEVDAVASRDRDETARVATKYSRRLYFKKAK